MSRDKFFKNKLYITKNDTTFIILAEDYEHHKGYTEYLIKVVDDKGCFHHYSKNGTVWIRSGNLLGLGVKIVSESEAIRILYGDKDE